MVDRTQLAEFLRSRRATPYAGPAARGGRLAGHDVDRPYYTRLEQQRGPRPSRQVLNGLARALRLTDDERSHLFHLAGEEPDRPPGPPREVRSSVLRMLQRLDDTPAMVIDAISGVLAWNDLAAALITDFSALPPRNRNLIRLRFLGRDDQQQRFGRDQTDEFARDVVADLRAATVRYPDDADVRRLVADLLAGSAEFRALWADHEVRVQRTMCKTVEHPVVGRIELLCEMLLVPEQDQRLVLYTAEPGTPSYEALQLLKVVGTQDLRPAGC